MRERCVFTVSAPIKSLRDFPYGDNPVGGLGPSPIPFDSLIALDPQANPGGMDTLDPSRFDALPIYLNGNTEPWQHSFTYTVLVVG